MFLFDFLCVGFLAFQAESALAVRIMRARFHVQPALGMPTSTWANALGVTLLATMMCSLCPGVSRWHS
jgi:hypothetical protein